MFNLNELEYIACNCLQYLRSESIRELREVDDAIVVLVKLLKQVAGVVLEGRVVLGQLFDLEDDFVHGGLWELVGVVLHVFLSVFVS